MAIRDHGTRVAATGRGALALAVASVLGSGVAAAAVDGGIYGPATAGAGATRLGDAGVPVVATTVPPPTTNPRAGCDPSYPTVCIPPAPPDLDCPDVLPVQDFAVLQPDPHGFDRDLDGIGCES